MHNPPLRHTRILISGAGVAGPALACCLARYGSQTTVVEVSPTLRSSGFAVDFRGPTHLHVLRELGVLDALRAIQTQGSALSCVDQDGRGIFRLPAEFTGGDIEVYRSDLSRVLHQRSLPNTEYMFGDTITALRETAGGVQVEFARAGAREFDLVVGADGLHSAVRRLAFGAASRYVRHLGHHLAGWSLPNQLGATATSQHYAVPGRMASVTADQRDPTRATALFVFASAGVDIDWDATAQQKQLIADTYAGLPWHVRPLLDTLKDAPELYFDSICRVRMPRWSHGRVVMLGDAAWGVTLGGMGVGTAVVGAYVLAGELAAAGGAHGPAYAAYERHMRKYAARWQSSADPGRFLAPTTAAGLWMRNTLFRSQRVRQWLLRSTQSLATDMALPHYA